MLWCSFCLSRSLVEYIYGCFVIITSSFSIQLKLSYKSSWRLSVMKKFHSSYTSRYTEVYSSLVSLWRKISRHTWLHYRLTLVKQSFETWLSRMIIGGIRVRLLNSIYLRRHWRSNTRTSGLASSDLTLD